VSECIKIVEGINKKEKCGVCVGIQLEGLPDKPEDVVALCTGELNENGHPKEQQFLTLEEAEIVGMALIRARAYYITLGEREESGDGNPLKKIRRWLKMGRDHQGIPVISLKDRFPLERIANSLREEDIEASIRNAGNNVFQLVLKDAKDIVTYAKNTLPHVRWKRKWLEELVENFGTAADREVLKQSLPQLNPELVSVCERILALPEEDKDSLIVLLLISPWHSTTFERYEEYGDRDMVEWLNDRLRHIITNGKEGGRSIVSKNAQS